MEKYENDLLNYPFTIRTQVSHKKGESDRKRIYCEDICTFDIETTSFFYDYDRKPFLYHPGEDPNYWCGVYAGTLCYLWQFGINGSYYYGRELDDFIKLLADFPPEMHVRIFVHNLPFEWNALAYKLTWNKIFAKTAHKPIKASCKEFPNIEFLCTLSLENCSLAAWGEMLGIPKLTGQLVYNVMRTPLTPLTAEELEYGQRDLEVMYVGLKKELTIYKSVWKLPMTSTGKIRQVVKQILFDSPGYVPYIKKLVPENPYQLHTSNLCFQGGYTHGNRTMINHVWENYDGKHGGHYDFTSSYPYELVANKFPCTSWMYMKKELPDPATFEDHAYKMHLVLIGIESQFQNNYISTNHCACVNAEEDNGRLMKADSCDIWVTELDWDIISEAYSIKKVEVLEVWEAKKDYLPLPFVEYVLQLFADKTELKGVDKDRYNMIAKPFLNGLFGLCCTNVVMGEVEYDPEDHKWSKQRLTSAKVNEHLEKIRKYTDKRYFLNYDWGVWCATSARHKIWKLIMQYDRHVLYVDTDSLFTNIPIDFTEYNKSIDAKLEKVCAERGLDVCKTRPKSRKGKICYLGRLVEEPEWVQFKYLGSKRYCERRKYDPEKDPEELDGKLHLTCAGINKEAVSVLKDDINSFKWNMVFDKDEEDVSKLLHTYVEYQPDITFPDGYVSHQRSGVNLRPNGYKLKPDQTYEDLMEGICYGLKNEQYENQLRSVWYDDLPFAEDVHYVQLNIGKE